MINRSKLGKIKVTLSINFNVYNIIYIFHYKYVASAVIYFECG
jgi:hypothetical protein